MRQIRNPHNSLAEFQAEVPLYERSGSLVAFLHEHRRQSASAGASGVGLVERLGGLAVAMYEYGIVGEADVHLAQAWLEDLAAVGYSLSNNTLRA